MKTIKSQTGLNLDSIKSKWQFILLIAFISAAFVFMVSAIIPPTYSSEVRLLILQKNLSTDSYRAAKSSEYAGEVIKEVIQSANFMKAVLESKHSIKDDFGEDPKERMEKWNKRITASRATGAGVMTIEIFHKNIKENKAITNAVIEKLLFDGKKYHGNENIFLKNIGGPIFSDKPEYPKVFLNTLIGGIAGIFLALGIIAIWGDKADSWIYANKRELKKDNSNKKAIEEMFEFPVFHKMAPQKTVKGKEVQYKKIEEEADKLQPQQVKNNFPESPFSIENNFSFRENFISDERGPGLEKDNKKEFSL
jgi:capsular polysaccharide biosynthesis protein